jgi:hypothetical protein
MYRIRNWRKFQRYVKKNPPWIRLYCALLDDEEWHSLDPKAAKLLVMLWFLAAQTIDGSIPSLKKAAFKLRMNEHILKSTIDKHLQHWLTKDEQNVSEMCANSERNVRPETETETDIVLRTIKTEKSAVLKKEVKPIGKRKRTDYQRALASIVFKYADEAGVPADARNGTFVPRNMRIAKILYTIAKNDLTTVYDAIEFTKQDCEKRKLSWTLETVEKRWGEYVKEKEVFEFKKKYNA